MNIKAIAVSSVLITSAFLQGCSGHPGAGHWQSSLNAAVSKYSALELEFNGKGTLHPNKLVQGQAEMADLWCLWQATSATVLDVQCGDGSAEKTNVKFEFIVIALTKDSVVENFEQARLEQEGKVVAMFDRKN